MSYQWQVLLVPVICICYDWQAHKIIHSCGANKMHKRRDTMALYFVALKPTMLAYPTMDIDWSKLASASWFLPS